MAKLRKNEFFDINKLPPEEGLLVFPISMSRISNAQSAKMCWEYVRIFSPSKIIKPLVGVHFIYSDYLYLITKEPAHSLRNKFLQLTMSHKQEFLNILSKNPMYIEKAFSFSTWNQELLNCKEFTAHLGTLRRLAAKDKGFQACLERDAVTAGKTLDDLQMDFFLEETLLFYLIAKGKLRLRNEYVGGQERWVLFCYPGKPLFCQAYLFQNDPFGLKNPDNAYEHHFYDLSERKLYDLLRIDINAWK